jgi:hypothetical protein
VVLDLGELHNGVGAECANCAGETHLPVDRLDRDRVAKAQLEVKEAPDWKVEKGEVLVEVRPLWWCFRQSAECANCAGETHLPVDRLDRDRVNL